jgi:hypothetical protein
MKRWFVLAVAVSALTVSTHAQQFLTGQDAPDSAAALYFLDARSEPLPHSPHFTAFIGALNSRVFGAGDAALLQLALERYYDADQQKHAAYLVEAEGYAQTGNTASLSNLQAAYQYQRIIRANSAIKLVSSQMSDKGAALARMLKGFKQNISVPPSDPTIDFDNRKKSIITAKQAAMHSHPGMPQGTSMGFSYGSWYTVDAVDSGRNPDATTYGTIYFAFGMEGTTNPCLGACITATHTAQMNYDHAASGKGTVTKTACAGPPYDVMGSACGYTYSWHHNGDEINNDTAFLKILCTIDGTPIVLNPVPILNNPANCRECTVR